MHLNRRNLLKGMTASAGTALGSSIFPGISRAASIGSGGPKRVIFFMQNQGFDPATCVPTGMANNGSLATAKLPEPIEPGGQGAALEGCIADVQQYSRYG